MRTKDEEKVIRIYNAAIKVVNSDGFEGSSMSKIATEANVCAATIYLYFENKDDVIKKLFLHIKNKLGTTHVSGDNELSPSKGTFRTLWINHYQQITNNFEEFIFYENFINSPLIDKIEKEYTQDYCNVFQSLFDRSKKTGLIQPLDNDILFSLLFAPINHLAKKSKLNDSALNMNELIQVFEASWKSVSKE
ncbi:MAG: TetR/AcrR family transcriptional regulator [Paludibacter sp.]|nr:TetR/AcrR family transcriptional regulator [Paludibacter sp.]